MTQLSKRSLLFASAAVLVAQDRSRASVQTAYPTREVKIVVDRPAGSPHDLLTRVLSEKLSAKLHQPFVVEDRSGAGGNLAMEYVIRSTPDGYTLLVTLDTTLTVNPALYKNLAFDPLKSLRPLSIMATSSSMLVVHPSIPVKTVAEFVSYAKNHSLTYGHGGNGSPGHLAMEYFRMQAGFPITAVPYRGNPQAVNDLLAGQVKAGFLGTAGVVGYVRAGRLQGLAISARTRSLLAPDIPTIAEAGYPDFKAEVYYVLSAPAQIPDPVAVFLESEVRTALQSPDLKEKFGKHGMVMIATSGAEAATRIKEDSQRWGKFVQTAHMTIN